MLRVFSLACLAICVLLVACLDEPEATSQVPRTPLPHLPTSTVRVTTPTVPATVAAVVTPEDVSKGMEELTRALNGPDPSGMAPLFANEVWLAEGPAGDVGQAISRNDALKWLAARWGKKRTLDSLEYVEHYIALDIQTSGWSPEPPVRTGVIVFHLHRFNADGLPDPLQGGWRIDGLTYE